MKTICLYFQVHQPYRLRRYHFFDIGNKHQYFDEKENQRMANEVAKNCYLPTNKLLLSLLKRHKGKFQVSFSISGSALSQFEQYTPKVLDSFKKLAKQDGVEFLCETYAHSLASVADENEFKSQVKEHADTLKSLFNVSPTTFRNTELIYDDNIAEQVDKLGFNCVITEGTTKALKWQSPNFLYHHSIYNKQNILFRNLKLSDDIAFRFSDISWDEYPLQPEKILSWIKKGEPLADLVNLFMDYETIGEHHKKDTGIFEFLEKMVDLSLKEDMTFSTPARIIKSCKSVPARKITAPISWADHEKDLSAWLGNDMQREAFNKLYELKRQVEKIKDTEIHENWTRLQASDHFYYMSTKSSADGAVHAHFNPYQNPYDAFVNYMNVINDFREVVLQKRKKG